MKKQETVDVEQEIKAVHSGFDKLTNREQETNKQEEWNIDEKYEGYMIPRANGKMEFYKKQTREVKDGMVKTKGTDEFTIQENSRYLKVTISVKKEILNFKYMMKLLDKLVNTMQNMKVL